MQIHNISDQATFIKFIFNMNYSFLDIKCYETCILGMSMLQDKQYFTPNGINIMKNGKETGQDIISEKSFL